MSCGWHHIPNHKQSHWDAHISETSFERTNGDDWYSGFGW